MVTGEEVWSGNQIVAMGDWELAAIGDPAYDSRSAKSSSLRLSGTGVGSGAIRGLAYYEGITGEHVSAARVKFYRELYGLLQFAYIQHVASIVRTMERPPLRFMWIATEVGFRSELKLACRLPAIPGERVGAIERRGLLSQGGRH